MDLFPTFLDYAGAASRPERPGTSLRAFLEKRADWTRDAVIGRMNFLRWDSRAAKSDDHDPVVPQPASFVRTREWHYIWHETRGEDELYDMQKDPDEMTNLIADPQYAAIVRQMCGRMWRFACREQDTATNGYITVGLAPYGPGEAFRVP